MVVKTIITVICVIGILVGAWLYIHRPSEWDRFDACIERAGFDPENPSIVWPDVFDKCWRENIDHAEDWDVSY